MKKLSIVISLYNENPNLKLLESKLLKNKVPGYKYEYIFVDDGSTDGSEKMLNLMAQKNHDIKIISLTRNFGHEIAMTAGMDHASGDAVIFMDADLQHPPEIIPEFIKEWEKGKLIVLGKRIWNPRRSKFYSIISGLYHRIFTVLTGFDASGDGPDFRLIDRYYIEKLKEFNENSRMFRGFVAWMEAKKDISEVEFEKPERSAGISKYNFKSLIDLGLDAIFAFSLAPMRLALILSLVGLFFSFAMGLYLYIPYVFEGIKVPGFLTVTFTVLIMGSAQLFILAIFAEYIGRIHFETKKRPLYVVKKIEAVKMSKTIIHADDVGISPGFVKVVEKEFEAQIEHLLYYDISISHIDSHRHVHMIKPILKTVQRLARKYDIETIRISNESPWFSIFKAGVFSKITLGGIVKSLFLKALSLFSGVKQRIKFFSIIYSGMIEKSMIESVMNKSKKPIEIMLHIGLPEKDINVQFCKKLEGRYWQSRARSTEYDACMAVKSMS